MLKASDVQSLELCAGAGGQALGLEKAGFKHEALIEIDKHACQTLIHNRPNWRVLCDDLFSPQFFKPQNYHGIDLLAGGLPCPPFSVAGKKLGKADERNLFDIALELISVIKPRAIMLENVKGFLEPSFSKYRDFIFLSLKKLGYEPRIQLLNSADYGVSQLRPRVIIVALKPLDSLYFSWPTPHSTPPPPVGEILYDLMSERGWKDALKWKKQAAKIAPTIVGGSKKHGGPDLGPTRSKQAWAELGVNGKLIGNEAPAPDFTGMPYLTTRMVARLQGFPDDWHFTGAKTNAYRQIGNAFPPPVAEAVGKCVLKALDQGSGSRYFEFRKAS